MKIAKELKMAMDPDSLLGRWEIVSWEQRFDDGRIIYPLGQSLGGFIQYNENGTMVCMIADRNRDSLSAGQWDSPAAEKAQAYSRFLAYSGKYTLNDNIVSHYVDISLYPNWEGGVQHRKVELDGNRLHILARLEENTTEARIAALTWVRA